MIDDPGPISMTGCALTRFASTANSNANAPFVIFFIGAPRTEGHEKWPTGIDCRWAILHSASGCVQCRSGVADLAIDLLAITCHQIRESVPSPWLTTPGLRPLLQARRQELPALRVQQPVQRVPLPYERQAHRVPSEAARAWLTNDGW